MWDDGPHLMSARLVKKTDLVCTRQKSLTLRNSFSIDDCFKENRPTAGACLAQGELSLGV